MPKLSFFNRKPEAPAARASFMYAIGPGGIVPIRNMGNPLLDAFHGIPGDAGDLIATDAGQSLAYQRSAWVYRCVKVRAQTLASVPLEIHLLDDQPFNEHPFATALRDITMLMYRTECDMAIFGRSYWLIRGNKMPRRLNPQTIDVVANDRGIQGFKHIINGQTIAAYTPQQVVYFYDYNPDDDLGGIAPVSLALGGVRVTENIGSFAEYYFENNAMPAGILVSVNRLIESDRERVLAEWKNKFQGVDKSHGMALLDGGNITYQPVTPPLTDLAMTELSEKEQREIAAALGVPLTVALMTDAANYATMKEQHVMLYTSTVLPELGLLVNIMNRQLLPRYGIENAKIVANADEIEVLQEDRTEITQRNQMGVGAGYLSINEARDREHLEPLAIDLFYIAGKPITREALEAGDLSIFEPVPAPAFPFGSFALPQREAPRQLEAGDLAPQKAIIDIVVHADRDTQAADARAAILRDTMLTDLDRWQRKVAKKGVQTPFNPDYLHSAITDFLRYDLLCAGDDTDAIKTAFDRAEAIYKADDDDTLATPEEFEAYWRGIGRLFSEVESTFDKLWTDLPARIASAIREAGQAGAEFDMQAFLDAEQQRMVAELAGTEETPGPMTSVFLAGAARGNDLLQGAKAALTIDWQIIDQRALAWAQEFSSGLIRGVNDTTLNIFREKIAAWVADGGSLEDLAKFIEGDLAALDIPAGWSEGKMRWATSRERARLIAQTETTNAFYEGSVARWEQAGVTEGRWRTQNDVDVDDEICLPLNNVVGNFVQGWKHPKTGRYYKPAAHPGCRCFIAPMVA